MEKLSVMLITAWIFIGSVWGYDLYSSQDFFALAMVAVLIALLVVQRLQIDDLKNELNLTE